MLLLTDHWADWEASYAVAEINSTERYTVKTIAVDTNPKVSIGGLKAEIDYTVDNYRHFGKLAMLVIPGGFSWVEHTYQDIAAFVQNVHEQGIPIAAICGATLFLAKHGFLNTVKHTGDDFDYFMKQMQKEENYKGQANFVSSQFVVDGGFITANETAALEFAREIFRVLEIDTPDGIDAWYNKYKYGIIP